MIGLYDSTWCFKTKNGKCVPPWLIIEKPISQYALYPAMFCSLHNSISVENMKSTSAIYPTITENMEDSLVKRVPHILTSISAISNSFHNITAVRSVSAIFVSCTEAITR